MNRKKVDSSWVVTVCLALIIIMAIISMSMSTCDNNRPAYAVPSFQVVQTTQLEPLSQPAIFEWKDSIELTYIYFRLPSIEAKKAAMQAERERIAEEARLAEEEAQAQLEAQYSYILYNQSAYSVPSGLTAEQMLEWIIGRESGGNIYGNNNGRYLGIGQLQQHHYQEYLGMSYEDTLNQPNTYELQQQAMQTYISIRYGSIEAAYNFWLVNGWY